MKNEKFQYIEPGASHDIDEIEAAVGSQDLNEAELVHAAVHLAGSGAAFFRGLVPKETPYAPYGFGRWLPWARDHFYLSLEHPNSWIELPIKEKVRRVMARANSRDSRQASVDRSDKDVMQELAVAAMLAADECLGAMKRRDFVNAALALNISNTNIFECVNLANQILSLDADSADAHMPDGSCTAVGEVGQGRLF